MFRPEITTDECRTCRTCAACLSGIHSCCRPVHCITLPVRHDCACTNPACEARRAAA